MHTELRVIQRLDGLDAWIVTVGGIGFLPIAPGTWCSFIIAAPVVVLPLMGMTMDNIVVQSVYLVAAVLLTMMSAWAIPRIQPRWGSDPKSVVIDEAIGMSLILALPFAYHTAWWWLASVLLFRVFDVQKPWPLSAINRRTEAWAVVVDDVLAAVFTGVALWLMLLAVQVLVLGGWAVNG